MATQEFLRSVGLLLEQAGCVIKQAQVTLLADTNSDAYSNDWLSSGNVSAHQVYRLSFMQVANTLQA